MNGTLRIEAASRTHVGLVRKRNEDSVYQGTWLYVVADGLGGHVAGDIASTTAIKAMTPYDRKVPVADLGTTIGHAVYDADNALRRKARAEPELTGMGTTVVALLWADDSAVLANVGDSRAYLARATGPARRAVTQISEDHTYVHLVSDAAQVPKLAEKLARFLDGRRDGRSPDLTKLRLQPGDRILLCSDGLSSYVPTPAIEAALCSPGSPSEVSDRLVSEALEHGGPDNVTVIVLDVHHSAGRMA